MGAPKELRGICTQIWGGSPLCVSLCSRIFSFNFQSLWQPQIPNSVFHLSKTDHFLPAPNLQSTTREKLYRCGAHQFVSFPPESCGRLNNAPKDVYTLCDNNTPYESVGCQTDFFLNDTTISCLQETHFRFKGTNSLNVKWYKMQTITRREQGWLH